MAKKKPAPAAAPSLDDERRAAEAALLESEGGDDSAAAPPAKTPGRKKALPAAPRDRHEVIRESLPGPPLKKRAAKPAPVFAEPADDVEEVDDELEPPADDNEGRRGERIPVPPRSRREDVELDDEEEDDRGVSEDTYGIAEELGWTRSDVDDEFRRFGSEDAVLSMLSRERRRQRHQQVREPEDRRRDDRSDDRSDDRRAPRAEERREDVEDDVNFDEEFSLAGDWEDSTKDLAGQIMKHISPRIRALLKKVGATTERISAHEQRVRARESMDQQRQLDKLFAEAGPKYAELFGKVATRKLPASSQYAANRDDLVNEMVAINESRSRRGIELLEMDELFKRACDNLHPHLVEARIQERNANERRSVRGTGVLRPSGSRRALPPGPERAAETLARKRKELGHDQ